MKDLVPMPGKEKGSRPQKRRGTGKVLSGFEAKKEFSLKCLSAPLIICQHYRVCCTANPVYRHRVSRARRERQTLVESSLRTNEKQKLKLTCSSVGSLTRIL